MNSSNKVLSCEEANKLDMVGYLSRLGFDPKRISGHQYWYLSPFRSERTASFKVNRNINCWYDFGEGKGGTLIDFGIRYCNCTVYDFLRILSLPSPAGKLLLNHAGKKEEVESIIEVTGIKSINSLSLRNYLKERKISVDIANTFCKEVFFRLNDKNYFAIGFANDDGGYELRNSFFKGSTHPKDITSFTNNSAELNLFEGFFDFLSYQTLINKSECVTGDYCVLNSLSFIDKAKDLISLYSNAHIFFDHDKSRMRATESLIKQYHYASDESGLYKNSKDLNEWLVAFGLPSKQSLRKSTKHTQ